MCVCVCVCTQSVDCVFKAELSAEQNCDVRAPPCLDQRTYLGDPACPACAIALAELKGGPAAKAPVAINTPAGAALPGPRDAVRHTCELGQACRTACTWRAVVGAGVSPAPTSGHAHSFNATTTESTDSGEQCVFVCKAAAKGSAGAGLLRQPRALQAWTHTSGSSSSMGPLHGWWRPQPLYRY